MKDTNIDKLFLKYNEALKILEIKFKKLYKELQENGEESSIVHIKNRLKSKTSIKNKLKNKLDLDYTSQNIEEKLHDIAGIRIVCPFLSDIQKVIAYVNADPDIIVIDTKNYIEKPKESGYSSYHMIVSVPVIINETIEYVKAEIQIRTIAMDFWASIEHVLCYKKEVDDSQKAEMKRIAQMLHRIDPEIDALARNVNEKNNTYHDQTQKIKAKKKITNHKK